MRPARRLPTFDCRRRAVKFAFAILLLAAAPLAAQTTGTFIDRFAPADLRVLSYNIYFDTIFADTNPVQAAKFARVISALNPDVVNLQEIYNHSAANVVSLMNSVLPLGSGASWHAYKSSDNVIASKYPLSLQQSNTTPASPRGIAIAMVDLPNAQYATDFYFMNNHFRCCGDFPSGPENTERQRQADALVRWMSDARTAGGSVSLPAGTPMAVVGDLNLVGGMIEPLNTLLSGNIINEMTYGPDSPPDWDGSSITDARPLHNRLGLADYTWRDDDSVYAPGRLDFVLYTDSVARVANQFVLNTVAMSPADLAAAGLQTYDVTLDATTYDHLPLVVDFRFVADGTPGDFNLDRVVNSLDYQIWTQSFGSNANLVADANGDHRIDAADYVIWRKNLAPGAASGASSRLYFVPEPASYLLWVIACGAAAPMRWWGRRESSSRLQVKRRITCTIKK